MKMKRVLILGGGFGGIYAALEFEKRQDPDFEVTLISQDNFFLFTPMLHEVAASDLDLTHIVNPIRKILPYYPNLRPEMMRVVLVHPEEFVLTELGQELGRYATCKLTERGIEIRPNTKIKAVTSNGVELTDGASITTRTLVWTAGISAHPLLEKVPLPKERQ